MKKQICILMSALLTLALLTACNSSDSDIKDTSAETGNTAAAVETETAAPETTEAVTEAPKRDSFAFISTYTENDARTPISLMKSGSSVATHFVFQEGFLESITANCPSWSNDIGSLTMKIYKWDTDYDTTIAADPVISETFVDYPDNDTLSLDLSTDESRGLEAGEYLWFLGDGEDSSGSGVGVWAQGFPEEEDAILGMYKDGKEITSGNAWECDITIVIPAE